MVTNKFEEVLKDVNVAHQLFTDIESLVSGAYVSGTPVGEGSMEKADKIYNAFKVHLENALQEMMPEQA